MHHKIQRGENLTKVAARYGTTVEALAEANGIKDANRIEAGQRLKIPTAEDKSAARRERFAAKSDLKAKFGLPEASPQVSTRAPSSTPTPTPTPAASPQVAAPNPEPTSADAPETESAPALRPSESPFAAPSSSSSGKDIKLKVPFYNQMSRGHGFIPGKKACYLAASAMARDGGSRVLGPANRIQVATAERRDGSIAINERNAVKGRQYIDAELEAGDPVVVGVSHKDAKYNVDQITDHFVVITGRGKDASGRTYYTFHDPASNRGSDAHAANRFYVDDNGKLYKQGTRAAGLVVDRRFEVSMVRRNG